MYGMKWEKRASGTRNLAPSRESERKVRGEKTKQKGECIVKTANANAGTLR